MTTAEILEAAANKIERDGWARGAYQFNWDGRGPACAYASMAAVAGGVEALGDRIYGAASAFARAVGGTANTDIYKWNDAPERTKEEVIAMLRAVAATEHARESLGDAPPEALPQNTAVALDSLESLPA